MIIHLLISVSMVWLFSGSFAFFVVKMDVCQHFMQIIKNDFAYVVEGDVFFAVDKFPSYGQLSGQKVENNRAGKCVPLDVSSKKRGPADFILWKVSLHKIASTFNFCRDKKLKLSLVVGCKA